MMVRYRDVFLDVVKKISPMCFFLLCLCSHKSEKEANYDQYRYLWGAGGREGDAGAAAG